MTARLEAVEEGLSDTLLHVGGYSPDGVPTAMVIFGFVVVLTTYAVINQYEAIRFLGARSEWDFKMAVLVACIATSICLFFNVRMGPTARAQFPGLEIIDQAYPLMIKEYLPAGLVGLVVAGLVAAGFQWREPGCSMCLAMNPDKLRPEERCALLPEPRASLISQAPVDLR